MLSVNEVRKVTLGQFLQSKRKIANLTQKELAEKVGCSRISIADYESDKREPHLSYIVSFCKAVNEKPSELLAFLDMAVQ